MEASGAGIASIAFLWEVIFDNLGESACTFKELGLASSVGYVAAVTPLMRAATCAVLLCLHCALFTLSVLHPRGSLCLIPRPCDGPLEIMELETRYLQWACIILYLAACALLQSFGDFAAAGADLRSTQEVEEALGRHWNSRKRREAAQREQHF
ncbi:hypothetical protein Efla_001848 [Eimeria flavescens]